MKLLEQLQILERLHNLIRTKATGTPHELAERLEVSERTIYNLLDELRNLGAVISYNKTRCCYYYESKITIEFLKVMIDDTDKITGGKNNCNIFYRLQNFCSLDFYPCTKLTNDTEHNTARSYVF